MAVDLSGSGARAENRRLVWVGVGIALVLLVALFVGAPAPAWASDDTINFSSPTVALGDTLATQYASQGVTFGQSPLGASQPQPLYVASSALAPSPANVARQECSNELCTLSQWIEFSPEVNHVSMSVAAAGGGNFSASVTLTAYDSGGNKISGSGGSDTQTVSLTSLSSMSVSAAGSATTIAYVQVTANDGTQGEGFEFTNLSYGPVAATPMPDFGLVNPGSTGGVVVNAGGPSASATLTLRRYGGSTGLIVLSHSPPPTGVTLDIAPLFDSDPDGSAVTLTFTAAADAPAVSQAQVTITGTPSSTAGMTPHSISVPVTVVTPQTTYGLRVQGLELTQGIQTFTLPTPTPPSRTVPYSGVKLVTGMPAVVRVFADAPNTSAPISNVGAQLVGTDSAGRPLPGSPLFPVSDELPLSDTGSATVPLSERYGSVGGYDFALPLSWLENATTAQPITLTATLTPPPESLTNPSDEVPCADPACVALGTFTLTDVTALSVGQTQIASVMLSNNGVTPSFTPSWFAWAKRLMPAGLDIFAPFGTLDITWVTKGCPYPKTKRQKAFLGCASRSAALGTVISALEYFAQNSLGQQNAGHNPARSSA